MKTSSIYTSSTNNPSMRTLSMRLHNLRLRSLILGFVAAATAAAACAGSPETTPESKPMSDKTYSRPSDEELRARLTPLQWKVTQEDGTERPFSNEYDDNKHAGIYVDIVSGEPLFSSNEKFDSGTGWPSFWAPIEPENIVEHEDRKLFMTRTEVRSKHGDSHLGHVFDDGPKPNRPALLHELGEPALHPGRGPRGRGLRRVPEAVRGRREGRRRGRLNAAAGRRPIRPTRALPLAMTADAVLVRSAAG